MNLVEVLMAASLLAISASASLQVWASGTSWSQRAQLRQQQQHALEVQLLAVQGRLQQLAGTPIAADCDQAAQWLLAELPELSRHGEGVLLRLQGPDGSERQRWYDPAAYGLCTPSAPVSDPGVL